MFACEQDDMDEATRALVEALQAEEERLVQQLETEVHPRQMQQTRESI